MWLLVCIKWLYFKVDYDMQRFLYWIRINNQDTDIFRKDPFALQVGSLLYWITINSYMQMFCKIASEFEVYTYQVQYIFYEWYQIREHMIDTSHKYAYQAQYVLYEYHI